MKIALTLLIYFTCSIIFSQKSWEQYIVMTNDSLHKNPIYNEVVLDAVVPIVKDTTFWPETQRLRIVFGDVLEGLLGLRWEAIHLKRTKLVGQSCQEVYPYDGPFTREYDINFFLVPHLAHYVDSVVNWWARAEMEGRYVFLDIIKNAKIRIPDKLQMGNWYLYIECENTPIKSKRPIMDSLFYPCLKNGKGLIGHQNFGNTYACIGLYGPAVMDCNHSCKPEIHPYEWIWWMKSDSSHSTKKEWYIGLHRDWSGRFRDWSTSPRIGKIKIPFLLKADTDIKMQIELLAFDDLLTIFHEEYFDDLQWLPSGLPSTSFISTDESTADTSFITDILRYQVKIDVKGVPPNTVKYRIYNAGEVIINNQKYIKGWLELGVAAKNLAEFRVVYDPED